MGSGKAHGKNLVFKLDTTAGVETDISTHVRSVDGLPGEVELGDITAAGDSGHKTIIGLQNATITLECVFDDTADKAWAVISNFAADTATRTFSYGPAGNTSGYAKLTGECRISKCSLPGKVTDPLIFTAELKVDGAVSVTTWA